MKITGQITGGRYYGKQTNTGALANSVAKLAKPLSGRFKQTLEEMAEGWDDLARREDKQDTP